MKKKACMNVKLHSSDLEEYVLKILANKVTSHNEILNFYVI